MSDETPEGVGGEENTPESQAARNIRNILLGGVVCAIIKIIFFR